MDDAASSGPNRLDVTFEQAARLAVDALYGDELELGDALLAHPDRATRSLALTLLRVAARTGLEQLDASSGEHAGPGGADVVAAVLATARAHWDQAHFDTSA